MRAPPGKAEDQSAWEVGSVWVEGARKTNEDASGGQGRVARGEVGEWRLGECYCSVL